MLRVYLDNCCYNRPYDDQRQVKVALETIAIIMIQTLVRCESIELTWSYVLDYENMKNKSVEHRETIQQWASFAIADVDDSPNVRADAQCAQSTGLRTADALHVACAIDAECDYLITVDKRLLKYQDERIAVCDPLSFLRILEDELNET